MYILIEVLDKKNKIIGFFEGNKFFDKKHKLIGFLDENLVKDHNGRTLLKLDNHDNIFSGNDQVGFILDSKIFFREEPIYEFSEEKKEINTCDGKESLFLKGNDQKIDVTDLFGIATIYFKSKWLDKIYY